MANNDRNALIGLGEPRDLGETFVNSLRAACETLDQNKSEQIINLLTGGLNEASLLRDLITKIEYQGFNIAKMLTKIVRLYNEFENTGVAVQLTVNGVETTHIFSTKGSISDDLFMLTLIFCVRGANMESIKKKSTPEFVEYFSSLLSKYQIVKKKDLAPDDIILPRIAALMTPLTYHFYDSELAKSPINMSDILGDGFNCLRHSTTAPLWPVYWERDYPYLYSYRLDRLINKKTKKYTPIDQIITYMDAAIDNTLHDQVLRVEVFIKYGMMDDQNGEPTREMNIVLENARDAWEEILGGAMPVPLDDNYPGQFFGRWGRRDGRGRGGRGGRRGGGRGGGRGYRRDDDDDDEDEDNQGGGGFGRGGRGGGQGGFADRIRNQEEEEGLPLPLQNNEPIQMPVYRAEGAGRDDIEGDNNMAGAVGGIDYDYELDQGAAARRMNKGFDPSQKSVNKELIDKRNMLNPLTRREIKPPMVLPEPTLRGDYGIPIDPNAFNAAGNGGIPVTDPSHEARQKKSDTYNSNNIVQSKNEKKNMGTSMFGRFFTSPIGGNREISLYDIKDVNKILKNPKLGADCVITYQPLTDGMNISQISEKYVQDYLEDIKKGYDVSTCLLNSVGVSKVNNFLLFVREADFGKIRFESIITACTDGQPPTKIDFDIFGIDVPADFEDSDSKLSVLFRQLFNKGRSFGKWIDAMSNMRNNGLSLSVSKSMCHFLIVILESLVSGSGKLLLNYNK